MKTKGMLVMLVMLVFSLSCIGLRPCSNTQVAGEPTMSATGLYSNTGERSLAFLSFTGPVTGPSADRAIRNLERAVEEGHTSILLEIDSPGGAVFAGMRLAKAIERSPVPVHCIVDGVALSMGYYLLQSCNTRVMTQRSVLMLHEPSTSLGSSTPNQLQDRVGMLRALSRALVEHMAWRMKISADELEERIDGRDWWMEHREATQVGAVDLVVDSVGTMIYLL